MLKNSLTLILCLGLLCFHSLKAQVPVFKSGIGGYASFRIPAIIKAPNGDLLAYSEGRVNGGADFGNIDIVQKRSSDNGRTWSEIKVIVDQDSLQAGNMAPVIDYQDSQYPNGRIFLFYNTGNNHEGEVRKGRGLREVWYITSNDNGVTWAMPTNITKEVHKPNYAPIYKNKEDWRSYAITPGHAVQSQKGKYKGRIFIAANHSHGEPQADWSDYHAHGFYTDDHGKTFHLAPTLKYPGSNEATAAFIGDKLIMNVRDQSGKTKRRIIAISENGGNSWSQEYVDQHLLDPVNEGSLLLLNDNETLAFSNARDTLNRNNLSIQFTKDKGKTWSIPLVVDKTDNREKKRSYTAYSDLVNLSNKSLGILYERNGYSEIIFKEIQF